MLDVHLRQAANLVLDTAIRLAPPDVREWGQAMRGELDYVEGSWASLGWAAGGVTVLAKETLISMLIPDLRRSAPLGPGLFARRVSLRKVALIAGALYAVCALIFFTAPPFRQGLRVSLAAWNQLLHVNGWDGQPQLEALRKRAEAMRDPEGLAFVSVRIHDGAESARLAQEAAGLDPRLAWIYGAVAVRHPERPEVAQWIVLLEAQEPSNALLPLIAAASLDVAQVKRTAQPAPAVLQSETEKDPKWQQAMTAAYASSDFDDYHDRLRALDHDIVVRYGLSDPETVLYGQENEGLPIYAEWDCERFAKSLLESGQQFERRGHDEGAADKYWTVARFGQIVDSHAYTDQERLLGASLQASAYNQLQEVAAKAGAHHDAALFGYLAVKFQPHPPHGGRFQDHGAFGRYTTWRNALVLQIASLAMILFLAVTVVATAIVINGYRKRPAAGLPRARRAPIVALTSSIGLLLSSATIYLTYRPYWYILQRATLTGSSYQTPDLRDFLIAVRAAPGFGFRVLALQLPVYLWTGIILAGVTGLILILLRNIRSHAQPPDLQQNPRAT